MRVPGGTPQRKIFAGNARQRGVQLNAHDRAKGIGAGEQHGSSHARTKIDERIRVDGRERTASPPAHNDALKHGRRDGIVGRDMAVVPVAGAKVPAGNQTTCPHAKFQVERMADQAVFCCKPRQNARHRYFRFSIDWRANAHVGKLAQREAQKTVNCPGLRFQHLLLNKAGKRHAYPHESRAVA
jgi:hypothetical protein